MDLIRFNSSGADQYRHRPKINQDKKSQRDENVRSQEKTKRAPEERQMKHVLRSLPQIREQDTKPHSRLFYTIPSLGTTHQGEADITPDI